MRVLAIDTSGPNCSACIMDETKVICDFNLNTGITHSETLLPMIDSICKASNIELSDIDVFACSIGPGSFTGLRIGLATIKGFALALEKKVIGIPTLEALAYNIASFDGLVCSVLDARNNNVYAGLYKHDGDKLLQDGEYIVEDLDTLIEVLKSKNSKVLFVGDGCYSFESSFKDALGENAFFAPTHLTNQLSSSVAKAALVRAKNEDFDEYDSLNPLYLKKSQAERELEGKK